MLLPPYCVTGSQWVNNCDVVYFIEIFRWSNRFEYSMPKYVSIARLLMPWTPLAWQTIVISYDINSALLAGHHDDVIKGAMASQITSLTIVYSTVYSDADQLKTSKLRVTTGLCAGNSPATGEFPAQMANNAENASIWWGHHVLWCRFGSTIHKGWYASVLMFICNHLAGKDTICMPSQKLCS